MKKFIITSVFILMSTFVFAQNYNQAYGTIKIYDTANNNPHDFIFSYDVINGVHTCSNNFEVVSKMSISYSFRFKIYFNDVEMYTGSVTLPAYGRYFFDNAFVKLLCCSISYQNRHSLNLYNN